MGKSAYIININLLKMFRIFHVRTLALNRIKMIRYVKYLPFKYKIKLWILCFIFCKVFVKLKMRLGKKVVNKSVILDLSILR